MLGTGETKDRAAGNREGRSLMLEGWFPLPLLRSPGDVVSRAEAGNVELEVTLEASVCPLALQVSKACWPVVESRAGVPPPPHLLQMEGPGRSRAQERWRAGGSGGCHGRALSWFPSSDWFILRMTLW